MVEYTCEECGKICNAKSKSLVKRFCSHKCANIHRWKDKEKKQEKLICKCCGKEFFIKSCDYRLKHSEIKYCSKECSNEGLKTGQIVGCQYCGKQFYSTRKTFCSRECVNHYRSEHSQHRTHYENGYLIEYVKDYNKKGNVKQHRRIMEEHLGRKLTKDEVVHHINGNKSDNRIENLQVMSRGEHSSLHRKQEKEKGKHLFGGYNNN